MAKPRMALDNLVDFIVTCVAHPQAANQTFLVSDGHDLFTTELVRGLARAAGVGGRGVAADGDLKNGYFNPAATRRA